MPELIDRRPPWIDRADNKWPTIAVGQTVEARYRDGGESSFIVRPRHMSSVPLWDITGDDNDIVAYRVVCDEEGKPINA